MQEIFLWSTEEISAGQASTRIQKSKSNNLSKYLFDNILLKRLSIFVDCCSMSILLFRQIKAWIIRQVSQRTKSLAPQRRHVTRMGDFLNLKFLPVEIPLRGVATELAGQMLQVLNDFA